ncbi:MAG: hypothetical protein AB1401_04760 [Thermodesulfobacteriota bacterium]
MPRNNEFKLISGVLPIVLALIGIVMIATSLVADWLGIGSQPGFGEKQVLLIFVGSLILLVSLRFCTGKEIFLFLLPLLPFLFFAYLFYNVTVEDTFITFRYASHLANGHGLVWNIGETPLEGYTSFLWITILSIFSKLGLDLFHVSKIIGIAFGLATIIAVYFAAYNLSGSIKAAQVASIICAVSPSVAFHSVTGMDTIAFTFFVTLQIALAFSLINDFSIKKEALLYVLFLLTGLARPEGVLIAIVVLSFLWAGHRPSTIVLLLFFVLPGLVYMIWRYSYFGPYLFPNSFYYKASSQLLVQSSVDSIKRFLFFSCSPFLILGVEHLIAANKLSRKYILIPIIIALFLIPYIRVNLWMGYLDRFFIPIYPLVIVFAAPRISELLAKVTFDRVRLIHSLFSLCVIIAFIGYPLIVPERTVGYSKVLADQSRIGYENAHIKIGNILKRFSNNNDYTLAVTEAGAIPFYSGWRTIDTGGLNDKYQTEYLAQHGGRLNLNYIYDQRPEIIIVVTKDPERITYPLDRQIVEDPRIKNYEFLGRYISWFGAWEIWEWTVVYMRRDAKDLNQLKMELKKHADVKAP